MKLHNSIGRKLLLFITPFMTTCAIGTLSAEAITLARSYSEFSLGNFSHKPFPESTFAAITRETETFAQSGLVTANATGTAFFAVEPVAFAFNTSTSEANGSTLGSYIGTALSSATVKGLFSVAANETFSFDYGGLLNLAVAIDQPEKDLAEAFGDISIQLINSNTGSVIDEFNLSKFLSSKPGNNELTEKFAGRYSVAFTGATTFELIETKTNGAQVARVPEASATLALMLVAGSGCVLRRQRDRRLTGAKQ